MHLSFQGMPSFRDPQGEVWVWDAESHTYVKKPAYDQPDRGHATGGDNDLFDPFQHTEESGVPELEGYMARTASPIINGPGFPIITPDPLPNPLPTRGRPDAEYTDRYALGHMCPQCGHGMNQMRGGLTDWCSNCGFEGKPGQKIAVEWAPPGQVKCPNCENATDQHQCPQCGKDLTPEWNAAGDQQSEFMDVHPPFDTHNEFISDPERVPKRNQLHTDDSYPSMNLSHTAPVSSVKPYRFSSHAEELAWREANDKNLEDCPECGDVMHDQDGEKVCHGCGHKQKIIHTGGAAMALAPEAAGLLGGGVGEAGGIAGIGGMGGGLPGIGSLMNRALGGGAFRAGENAVGGGDVPNISPGPNASMPPPGIVSHRHAGIVGDIVEFLVGRMKATPEAFMDPANPVSYADDVAGAAIPSNGGGYDQGQYFGSTFGEEETGTATKNRGDNSNPDDQTSSGSSSKEHGDSPEQLKDSDEGGSGDPSEEDPLALQGDPELQDKALRAFHINKPLVIELAQSGEGSANPILLALDALLEEAFPGYRHGADGDETSEHPLEGNNEEPSDDSDSSDDDPDEPKDDKPDSKESSTWAKQGLWSYLEDHEAGAAPMMNGSPFSAAPTQAPMSGAPGVMGANPPCPSCGQPHAPGTPCVQDAQQFQQPAATGAPMTPPQPSVVTTSAKLAKWELVSSVELHMAGPMGVGGADEGSFRADTYGENPPCPYCGGPNDPDPTVPGGYHCRNCHVLNDGQKSIPLKLPEGFDTSTVPGTTTASFDAEFGFYATAEHEVHHHHEPAAEWVDIEGAPLQEGHDYDLTANEYSIPDKVTISRILPDKITYTIHASPSDPSSLPYTSELTRQALATEGYKFSPIEAGDDSNVPDEHPVRPGQDPTPQVDDLSTPSTTVSHVPVSLDNYQGSFTGDAPDGRSWIMEGGDGRGVDVDPELMAKFAGKDFSGQEQRAFIDEDGTARNLDKLDLEGTHYVSDDIDAAFNW